MLEQALPVHPKWLPMFPPIEDDGKKTVLPVGVSASLLPQEGHLTSLLPAGAGAQAPHGVNTDMIRCLGATLSRAPPADKTALSSPPTRAETRWPRCTGRPHLCHGWEQQLSGKRPTKCKVKPLGAPH